MTTYYVATDGSGDYATITQVNAKSFAPGDSILFRRGDTFNDAQLSIRSGTSDSYITYGAYGAGEKPLFNQNAFENSIYAYNDSYFIIDNLQFSNGTLSKQFIFLQISHHCEITNCYFEGETVQYAILAYLSGSNIVSDILVENCEFNNAGSNDSMRFATFSLSSYIHDITVQNNNFYNLNRYGVRFYLLQTYTDAGMAPRNILIDNNIFSTTGHAAVIIDSALDVVISNNTLLDIGDPSNDNVNALQTNNIKRLLIKNNSITNVYTSLPDGHAIILDWGYVSNNHLTEDAIVEGNFISGCHANGRTDIAGISTYKAKNCIVRNNIIFDCGTGISQSNLQCIGNSYYNNTVYDCDSFGMAVGNYWSVVNDYPTPLCRIKNNIFKDVSYGIYIEGTTTVLPDEDYNCFHNVTNFNVYDHRNTPYSEISIGSHSITSDPLLRSDYGIQATSPCKDAGVYLSSVGDDFLGVPRPQGSAYDIGAFEYTEGLHFNGIELEGMVVS